MALDVDHPGVVKQPIEDGRGDDGIAEEFLPVDEALVRGDDRRAFFIAVGDELEEEIGFPGIDGEIAHFIHDDEGGVEIGLPLGLGFLEFADQGVHSGEVDLEAVAAGLDGEGDGQMGFPHPGRAEEDDVFVFSHEGQIEELHDGLFIQVGMEGEVVFLDRLAEGEPGDLEGGIDPSFFLGRHLLFQQVVQEGKIRGLAFFGAGGDGIEHFRRPNELQAFQVVLEAFTGQLFHRTPPRAYFSYSDRGLAATSTQRLFRESPRVALPLALPYLRRSWSLSCRSSS